MDNMISEALVSQQICAEIFRQASFNVFYDDDGDLHVSEPGTLAVMVRINPRTKLIQLTVIGRFVSHADPAEVALLLNRMNAEISTSRFSCHDIGVFVSDMKVAYHGWLVASQLVAVARTLVQSTIAAANQFDTQGLIQ